MRKKVDLKRRSFLPAFLVAALSWLTLFSLIFFYAPETKLLISLFYLLLFISCFLTFSLLLANSRRGVLLALGVITLLSLKQIQQAHFLNLFLIGGILLSIELYFRRK